MKVRSYKRWRKKSQKEIFMKWRVCGRKGILVRHCYIVLLKWCGSERVMKTEDGSECGLCISLTNQPLPENYLHQLSKSIREAPISLHFQMGTPPAQHESERMHSSQAHFPLHHHLDLSFCFLSFISPTLILCPSSSIFHYITLKNN